MEIHHEIHGPKLSMKNKRFGIGKSSLHWHEKIEMVLAFNKPFDIIIEGERYELNPGDLVLIGERVLHLYDIKEDNTEVRIGQFTVSALLGAGISPCRIQPHITRGELEEDDEFHFKIKGILHTISRETVIDDEENPFLQTMLSGLYCLLSRRFALTDSNIGKKEKTEFYKIVEYVNEHFKENISVQKIAKSLYIDRGRLSSLFLKYSGVSLTYYLNSLRVSCAKSLLESGAMITDAALESGFQSVRTFNEVYRRHTGNTPSKLKKHK
jgi:AraC-like DNA-binding protein